MTLPVGGAGQPGVISSIQQNAFWSKHDHEWRIVFHVWGYAHTQEIASSDNFDELKLPSDSVLPHVRTDIVKYLKGGRGFSITRLQADYISRLSKNIYSNCVYMRPTPTTFEQLQKMHKHKI